MVNKSELQRLSAQNKQKMMCTDLLAPHGDDEQNAADDAMKPERWLTPCTDSTMDTMPQPGTIWHDILPEDRSTAQGVLFNIKKCATDFDAFLRDIRADGTESDPDSSLCHAVLAVERESDTILLRSCDEAWCAMELKPALESLTAVLNRLIQTYLQLGAGSDAYDGDRAVVEFAAACESLLRASVEGTEMLSEMLRRANGSSVLESELSSHPSWCDPSQRGELIQARTAAVVDLELKALRMATCECKTLVEVLWDDVRAPQRLEDCECASRCGALQGALWGISEAAALLRGADPFERTGEAADGESPEEAGPAPLSERWNRRTKRPEGLAVLCQARDNLKICHKLMRQYADGLLCLTWPSGLRRCSCRMASKTRDYNRALHVTSIAERLARGADDFITYVTTISKTFHGRGSAPLSD